MKGDIFCVQTEIAKMGQGAQFEGSPFCLTS